MYLLLQVFQLIIFLIRHYLNSEKKNRIKKNSKTAINHSYRKCDQNISHSHSITE